MSKLLPVAWNLLVSACSFSYIRKYFSKPQPGRTHYFTDNTGRICIYHGANVSNSTKYAADFLPWQTKEDFAKLKTWGLNLVRYIVLWEAIEPHRGPGFQPETYDTTYIQATLERLKWLQELGIDVVIDFHQDLYNRKFTGNGFPEWAVHDKGIPFVCQKPWNMNYFQPAVVASYDYFWKDDDLKKAYIRMLNYAMTQFDGLDNVIGFDVMNEPFMSTIPSFEKKILTKFYMDIQAMMSKQGFKSEMGFEPHMYTSAGIPTNLEFEPLRDCFFFPHYYDAFCHEGGAYKSLNRFLMKQAIAINQRQAQEFGVPWMVGEFGISDKISGYDQYLKDFVRESNEGLFGWTYYCYDKKSWDEFGLANEDGTPSGQMLSIMSVYAQKIAGVNPVVRSQDNSFILEYDLDPKVTGPTEIFIPQGMRGIEVRVNGKEFPCTTEQAFIYNNDENKNQHICVSWL